MEDLTIKEIKDSVQPWVVAVTQFCLDQKYTVLFVFAALAGFILGVLATIVLTWMSSDPGREKASYNMPTNTITPSNKDLLTSTCSTGQSHRKKANRKNTVDVAVQANPSSVFPVMAPEVIAKTPAAVSGDDVTTVARNSQCNVSGYSGIPVWIGQFN